MKRLRFVFFLVPLTLFCRLVAFELGGEFSNESIRQQAYIYKPELVESFYHWVIPTQKFLDFLEVYKDRPFKPNHNGMRSNGNFFLWYFLQKIQPALVIESGVFRGQSTWMIEHSVPDAKIISLDPNAAARMYNSPNATYPAVDFADLEVPHVNGPVVVFFDDHQNDFDRVIQAHKKGIKYLIFDDNYVSCKNHPGEFYSLTLRTCFENPDYQREGNILRTMIKHYYIMPQIIDTASGHPACRESTTRIPAIWKSLKDVPASLREQLKPFSEDSWEYRWITFVELY